VLVQLVPGVGWLAGQAPPSVAVTSLDLASEVVPAVPESVAVPPLPPDASETTPPVPLDPPVPLEPPEALDPPPPVALVPA